MAPKKDKADKKDDSPEDKLQSELKALELAKQDLEIGHAVLADSLRQTRAENERLLQEVERFRNRIINANKDYADILEHREEQVRVAEGRSGQLQQELERLQATITALTEELAHLKEVNQNQALRLEDAAAMLTDRDALEATVKKQHDLIERQAAELKLAKAQIDAKETALEKAKQQVDELSLKCAGSTTMRVLFSEPWLVQITHSRLRGELPYDRECNTLSLANGGKQLILLGGAPRGKDPGATELSVLALESLNWTRGNAAILGIAGTSSLASTAPGAPASSSSQVPTPSALLGHTATPVGRNKLLVFGGRQGKVVTADTYLLALDTYKWTPVSPTGPHYPTPRLMHAAACIRDKVYVFGGMDADGQLMNDMWMLDMDSGHWHLQPSYGYPPSPRRGCTMCATEDGRRLYIFGGYDGGQLLNDVYYCEAERGIWSPVTVGGQAPEAREGHTAAMIGKYLLVTGGCGNAANAGPTTVAAAMAAQDRRGGGAFGDGGDGSGGESLGSGARRLNDTYLMDLYTGPWWECLDDGAWGTSLVWMKQMSCYSVLCGNKLLTLRPNLHEQLEEVQVLDLTLPEDIERLRAAKKRDTEQVDKLEILEESSFIASTSIEVVWQAPSKNSERILGFKVMVASSTGVVREAYQGKGLRHKVVGLKPNAEYVFCVKATYEDGSHIWSESKAFRTRMA